MRDEDCALPPDCAALARFLQTCTARLDPQARELLAVDPCAPR